MCTKTTWMIFKKFYGNELWQVSPFLSSNYESKKTENNGEVINKSQVQKLVGVHVDYEWKFDTNIETLCEKVGKNLLALSRVIKFMSTNQPQLLMKSFTMSQFSYCRLTWMCHRRNINNQIDKLDECALRLTYNDKNPSFWELLKRDKSVTIHERVIEVLLTVKFKVKSGVGSKIMTGSLKFKDHSYNLRKNNYIEKQIK